MKQRNRDDLLSDLRGRLVREALRDRQPGDESLQAPFLEGPFVLVELAAGHPVAAADLGDVSYSLGNL